MENIPIKKNVNQNQVNPNLDVPEEVRKALEADAAKSGPSGATQSQPQQYPTEIIELPSKGHFYPPESPLSSGQLELKFMTAKEEDILTSQNLIKKGVALDRLLESLIVTPGISLDDLLICDKNAVFVASRILAYGPQYTAKVKCPACGAEEQVEIMLDKLENKPYDFSKYSKGINQFEIELPVSKRRVTYKLLTHKDEMLINQELKAVSRVNKTGTSPEITTRLKYLITSVDGNSDTKVIRDFVDNLLSRDALAIRKGIKEVTPELDMTMNFECSECGHQEVITIPLGIDFFWPDAGV